MRQPILLLAIQLFFILPLMGEEGLSFSPLHGAQLQAKVKVQLLVPSEEAQRKIQPGSPIQLSATVKNVGDKTNIPGKIFVRFAFQKPLDHQVNSIIFETENKLLPSIDPGKSVEVIFDKTHKWPSFFDYIRNEWNMREYEVVAVINNKSEIIGRASISVSAHHYQGPEEEIPSEFDSAPSNKN